MSVEIVYSTDVTNGRQLASTSALVVWR